MKIFKTSIFIMLLLKPVVSFAQISEDPILIEAFALPVTGPLYNAEIHYKTNEFESEMLVSPNKAKGNRVKVLTPQNRDVWPQELIEEVTTLNDDPENELWCGNVRKLIGDDIHRYSVDPEEVVFQFSPKPGPTDDADDKKFLSHMTAFLTVNRKDSQIIKFSIMSKKPFKPVFIVKISEFSMQVNCSISRDGRPYASTLETKISGRIALVKFADYELKEVKSLSVIDE